MGSYMNMERGAFDWKLNAGVKKMRAEVVELFERRKKRSSELSYTWRLT